MDADEVKMYSWIIRGSQRVQMIKIMDRALTPTQIRKLTGLGLNNVSDNLRLFAEHKVAKCLNEKEKLGRIYILTDKGKRVREEIENNSEKR